MKRLLQKRGWNNLFQTVFGTTCPKPAKRIAALAAAFLILAPPSAQGIIDTNNNGVSDIHERQYNSGDLITNHDLNADPDGDGWTNEQEAAAGTDPFDANPPKGFIRPATQHFPEIWGDNNGQPVLITPEYFNITWPLTIGKQYTLQFSFDLSAGSWITLGSPFIAAETVPTYYFPVADAPKRFWRVAVTDFDTDGDGLTDAEEHQIGSSRYLFDTDNDGTSDAAEIAFGSHPAGDGPDADGDGIPDSQLYCLEFEILEETREIPRSEWHHALQGIDNVHRYLTRIATEDYSISGSARYTDIPEGSHTSTSTYLSNGQFAQDGGPIDTEEGTTMASWKSDHQTPIGQGEILTWETPQITVSGTITNPDEFTSTTTTKIDWEIKKNGQLLRSGRETEVITHSTKLSDSVTIPEFWNQHFKTKPWQDVHWGQVKWGPLGDMEHVNNLRATDGDAIAAEIIRQKFIEKEDTGLGFISGPTTWSDDYSGRDQRLKYARWRWVRFNPRNPFEYEHSAPPDSSAKRRLHVEQHDYMDSLPHTGAPPLNEQIQSRGVIALESMGSHDTGWHQIPLETYRITDPSCLSLLNYKKWGYSQVYFRHLPVEFKTYPDNEAGPDKAHNKNLTTRQDETAKHGVGWEKVVCKVWNSSPGKVNLIDYLHGGPGNYSTYEDVVKWRVNGTDQTQHELFLGPKPDPDKHTHFYVQVLPKSGGDTLDRLIITIVPPETKTNFDNWYAVESTAAGKAWFTECPRMPSSLEVAPLLSPDRLFSPRIWRDPDDWSAAGGGTYFHPDAYYEIRAKMTPGGHGHQTTFTTTGGLILSGVSAGTADKAAAFPENWDWNLHVVADVTPFMWALQLDGNPCDQATTTLTIPMLHEGAFIKKYMECRPPEPNAKPRFAPGGTP